MAAFVLALSAALLSAGAARAQPPVGPPIPDTRTAEDGVEKDRVRGTLDRAAEAYGQDDPEAGRAAECPEPDENTVIIVCGRREDDPERFREPSRLERGDDSHLEWIGRAPDVAGPGIFTGPATIGGLCIIPPCPPPPVYMIDVTALPEAPPGSDADRIARGLAPRGAQYDDGEAVAVARIEAEEDSAGDEPDVSAGTTAAIPEGNPVSEPQPPD